MARPNRKTDNVQEQTDMDSVTQQASTPEPVRDAQGLTEEDRRRRRSRSIALAVTLGLLVALFYVVTIAKLGPGVLDRPM
jgi:hypothetical protein